ncbi:MULTISPECIES: hypothetical protein [Rhodopseudomonas]|jgi:hypothetical protein|uniref:Uncharacterized protein n=1 Tax=Rhodopseudomonas palustris (strain DX-1) TaxID=652103 RepID=E6VC58_RHOPX|nr:MULTISPECIES: hypothetical protein [Rhodopseudomonas]NEW89965.1 hypothetical protein [Rhodopseudomonas sp. WA056]QDL96951.1 hypothetical protein FLL57_06380 [Rhodopseudomonas palustris]
MPPTALHPGVIAGSQPSLPPDAAEIAVLSPCAETLAAFAEAWTGDADRLHTSDLASFAAQACDRSLDSSLLRAILIVLPDQADLCREAVEAITAFAGSRRIAFAVLSSREQPGVPSELITNLPPTTLRRLNRLYIQRAGDAARAILMQFALAAGLSISAMETSSDSAVADTEQPPSLLPELIEDAAR